VRQVTKFFDPKRHAIWTLGNLYGQLCQYLYEVYDTTNHPAFAQSPREAYLSGLNQTGCRLQRLVAYDRDFLMSTLPTTRKGTAKISPGRGVKVNHLYYWSDAFRDPEIERAAVAVRFDPFDAGIAYVFARKQWVECHSEYYSAFRGRSEKEIMLATEELRRIQRIRYGEFKFTARKLAEFLQCAEVEEASLTQRLRDRESRGLREVCGTATGESVRELTCDDPIPDSGEAGEWPPDSTAGDEVFGEF